MTSLCGTFCYTILALLVSSNLILSEKNSTEERVKRNNNEFHLHAPLQSRRLNDDKSYSAVYNKLQPFNPTSHPRPRHPSRLKPVHVPPYAVKMEPLVQYSQRDPLYHDKETPFNISTSDLDKHSKVDTFADTTNNFVDYVPRYGPPAPAGYDVAPSFQHFYKEPEPIIEIIIKESNESLPTQPVPTHPPTTTVKEPIQVFYVKYKKNRTHTGKEEVVYEEPIPALTPLSTDIVENHQPATESYYPVSTYQNPSPPSTTYRTIIRPDSEVYHGTGLKVTFGNQEESYPQHPTYEHRSSEAQKRDSVVDQNETLADLKHSASDREHNAPQKHVLEHRQSQTDYVRFANIKSEPTLPPHNIHQRQNQHSQTAVSQHLNLQPLQIEDGSFERPPPPSFPPQNNPQKIAFPSPHSNLPFRPQHTPNFQQPQPQSNDFAQPDLSLLQRQTQHQFQFLPQHPQINSPPQSNKIFPRLTQAVLQQFQFPQSQQYPNQDQSQYSLQLLNNAKPQHQLQNDANRFGVPGRHNLINLNNELQQQPSKPNRIAQPSPNELNSVNYNPQVLHHLQTTPYGRNEFLQPFSNQQKAQSQQAQIYQQQQQQLNAIERQKQLQFEKVRQSAVNQKSLQRRPVDGDKYQTPPDYLNQFQSTEKTLESKPQPTSIQPNYREVVPASQHRQSPKQQKHLKDETTTVSTIQDGQIYQSISQLEEHQILSADQFGLKQNHQQQYRQQPTNYENALQSDSGNFKPPKQVFETGYRPVYQSTTAKSNPQRVEQSNTTRLGSQQESSVRTVFNNKKKESHSSGKEKDKSKPNTPSQLAELPAEVPDDLREQLLASGILSNADIQILDYDKVGDIPIENLPPEALENLYGAGSAPVPSVTFANASKSVEMKVVRYDPATSAGQSIPNSYVQEDSTEVDPVVLNDSSYNRYLPLKVKGSQFPIPDTPLLKNKKITSVVVLAPVDYDYVQQEAERQGKSVPQVHGVRFISGESLKMLVKNPTENNFVRWIEKERETPPNKQSVILLVTNSTNDEQTGSSTKEIFMYDIPTGEISKLEGELSSAFVNVAESNAESEDLENLSENADEKTPVTRMTSIPVHGSMSEQFKNKSRRAS